MSTTALRLRRAPAEPPRESSRAIVARTKARQIDLARTRLRQPRAAIALDRAGVWRVVWPSARPNETAASARVSDWLARALAPELRPAEPGPADVYRFVLAEPDLFTTDTPRL